MKNFSIVLALFSLILFSNQAKAILAYPQPTSYSLPNGKSITIQLHGDEHFNWVTTIDGYRIALNKDGYFAYVSLLKSSNIELSEIIATNPNERTTNETNFINTLPKYIGVKEQVENIKKTSLKSGQLKSASIVFPNKGIRKNLLILANFSDQTTSYTQSNFNDLMNKPNYRGVGSFRDYYLENSNNTLDITTTVTVWVTVPNTNLYYSNSTKWAQFAYDAIKAADAIGIDFSQFEKSGTQLTGVTIIHQGKGQETSGNTNDIWSHQGELSSYKASSALRTFDGLILDHYSIQPEIFDNAGSMCALGIVVHEFGHLFGLPDFYDTDYAVNGQYDGTGQWDLMAAGAYNGSYNTSYPNLQEGACPAHHNALSKNFLNWITIPKINSPQTLILNVDSAFKIETTTNKEYFYLENRKKIGFDAQLPGEGMLVYHVDSTWIDQHAAANDINAASHQGLFITTASGGYTNSIGAPFPGSNEITALTDNTTPNMKSLAGDNTNKSVTNINRAANGVVTFDFMSLQNGSPQTFEAKPYTSSINMLNWTLSTGNNPVIVAFSTTESFGAPINSSTYSAGNILPGGGTVLYTGSNTTFSHTALTANTTYYYKIWSNSALIYSSPLTANTKTTNSLIGFPWNDPIEPLTNNWVQKWVSGSNTNWTYRNGGFYNKPSKIIYKPGVDTTIVTITQFDAGSSQSRLISPTFITEAGKSYRLSFKHAQPGYKGDQDVLRLLIKPMLNTSWNEIAVFNTDIPNWKYQDFDLPEMTEPFQIAFENTSYNGYGISIDSISLVQNAPLTPINHKIIVKNSNQLIGNATVTLLEQSLNTNSLGEALFANQKPSRNWELIKVEASGYEDSYTKMELSQAIIDTLYLIKSEAITPNDFTASKNYQSTTLNWSPVIDESFEGYTAWDTTKIGSWLLKDTDKGPSGGYSLFDYPYNFNQSAFVVFDGKYGGNTYFFQPHSGSQMAVSFYSAKRPNNDWMISPQTMIISGDNLELFAKSANDFYGLETMRILVSETNTDSASFIPLHATPSLDVPTEWTKYSYDLTVYAGKKVFIAVNCTSYDRYALLIDDIKIKNINASRTPLPSESTTNSSTPLLTGNIEYQIIRDGAIVATVNGFEKSEYTDIVNDCETHIYALQTNYLLSAKKSAVSTEQEIVSCRIVKVLVKENTTPVEGITVKLDTKTILTNSLGEATFNGISDGVQSLNISKLGYNTINESITISKDSSITRDISPLTLIPEKPFDNLKLAPYPCDGNFTLTNIDLPVPFDYTIFTIGGDLVQSGQITKIGQTQLSINSTTSGTYLIHFILGSKKATRKLLVIK